MERSVYSRASALALISALGVAACGAGCSLFDGAGQPDKGEAQPRVYEVGKIAEGDPAFKLVRVTATPSETRLDMQMTGADKETFTIGISRPGSSRALFIETAGGDKIPLVSSSGIAIDPERETVLPGQIKTFTLVFGPLDPAVRRLHVFEGEEARDATLKEEEQLWVFRDVELR